MKIYRLDNKGYIYGFYDIDNMLDRLQEIIDCDSWYDYKMRELYDNMLDECYCTESGGVIQIGCGSYYPSEILKSVDPLAYGCGYDDYLYYEVWDNAKYCIEENGIYEFEEVICEAIEV